MGRLVPIVVLVLVLASVALTGTGVPLLITTDAETQAFFTPVGGGEPLEGLLPGRPGVELTSPTALPGRHGRLGDPVQRSGAPGPLTAEEPRTSTGSRTSPVRLSAGADAEPRPRVFTYTVRSGDTLWDIAQEHGITVTTIMGANPDLVPSRLQVGQEIRLLSVDGVLHTVQPGDTVSALAEKYGVEPDVIVQANALDDPEALEPGTEVIIPGATPTIVRTVIVGGRAVAIYGEYRWPVLGPVTSYYGPRWGRFHHGIDIGAPYGSYIRAARAGRVVFAGWKGGYGYTVILDHGDGVTTLYAHASRLLVRYGQWVETGQVIAKVGSTGYSTGPHLHFEVRVNGVSVNPLFILN
ncbi:MAG TPA: hypothetical protein DHW14_08735 [Clostridiales bacterium]|nr:hypothetical protein [Clostridiales bacterium]